MPTPPPAITSERLAEARRLYEDTGVPLADIAAMLGVGASTLMARIPRLGWRRRKRRHSWPDVSAAVASVAAAEKTPGVVASPSHSSGEAAAPASVEPNLAKPDLAKPDLAIRVQRAIERELDAIEKIIARLGPASANVGEAERAARTLASLARTLKEVTRLDPPQAPTTADDEAMPRDYDELRRALSEKLERIVAEQSAALPEEP